MSGSFYAGTACAPVRMHFSVVAADKSHAGCAVSRIRLGLSGDWLGGRECLPLTQAVTLVIVFDLDVVVLAGHGTGQAGSSASGSPVAA